MEIIAIVSMGLSILGILVFGVFAIAKRLDTANELQKELVELQKNKE